VYSGPPEDAVGAEDESVQPLEAAGLLTGLYKALLMIQPLINFNYDFVNGNRTMLLKASRQVMKLSPVGRIRPIRI